MPGTANYVSLDLFKTSRNVAASVSDHDAMMDLAISAASRQIDAWTGRGGFDLDPDPSARIFDPVFDADASRDRAYWSRYGPYGYNDQFGRQGALIVDDIGALDGLLVEQGDGATWTDVTAQCEVQPTNAIGMLQPANRLYNPSGWTIGPYARIRVTARWGWPVIPDRIVQATLIYAGKLFERRNSVNGTLGPSEWGVVRVGRCDPDVAALIGSGFTDYGFA